jgi:hypothetical protein
MGKEGFRQLRGAYSAAWATRVRLADASGDVLLAQLRQHGLHEFADAGIGRDLILGFWQRGVPPDRLQREFRRAVSGLAVTALTEMAGSAREVWRFFRDQEWEALDLSWLDLPVGHRRLTEARHSNDLLLRWFHPSVDEASLELALDEEASEVLRRCRVLPSASRSNWFEAPAWLKPEDQEPHAEVMVGTTRIGRTRVPERAWSALKAEQARNVYADGALFLAMDETSGAAVELKCYLPR